MMERFERINLSGFEKVIKEDISSRDYAKFPTRFILVENFKDWINILKTLRSVTETTISLSEFCKDPKVAPDVNEAVNIAIKNVKNGKKVLFVPFSEYMRFFTNYKHFLAVLSNVQIDPKQNGKLYVPLVFSTAKFNIFWNKIPISEFQAQRRKLAIEIIPSDSEDIRIYVTNIREIPEFSKHVGNSLVFKTYQDYLRFFEEATPDERMKKKPIIFLLSDIIFGILGDLKIEDPLIHKIEDYKSFLESVFRTEIPIPFKKEENEFWKKLTKDMLSKGLREFKEFVKYQFNVIEFRTDVFKNWKNFDDYTRWLLFNWGKIEVQRNANLSKYLSYVFSCCDSFSELEREIWLRIFDIKDPEPEIFEDRRKLIEIMSLNPPKNLFEKVLELKDPKKRIKYLTATSFEEKRELIKNFAELIESGKDLEEILSLMEKSYPELYYYLSFPPVDSKYELVEYFNLYKIAKLTNNFEKYEAKLSQIAEKIKIYELPSRNEIIERIEGKKVFIDGMGLEWLGLIYHYLKQNYAINIHIARCVIPTTSDFNKPPEDSIQLRGMDLTYHTSDLEYPDYLIKEIEVLKDELKQIEKLIEEHGKVILTSDHGSTRFSGWSEERIDIPLEYEVERNGRYAKTKEKPPESPDYYFEEMDGTYYLISKTHKIFKGGKRVKVENHGGATLEEVLIPLIEISKSKPKEMKMILRSKEILLPNPVLRIQIIPEPEKTPLAKIKGRIFEASKVKDGWEINLRTADLKPGPIKAEILINGKAYEIEIKIKGGMEEEELI